MKAAQIKKYAKKINVSINEVPVPVPDKQEVLIRVKAAAVNPLENLILTGRIRLVQDYHMPLTLGNECAGIVESVGEDVRDFKVGDSVYTLLPLPKIGAFAEYVAVDCRAVAPMPSGYDFVTAAAIPLTGLTAYQGLVEELEVQSGKTLLIPGGSGSFGQMAVPIAKAMGLRVIITGNRRSREKFEQMGVDQYIVYTEENYWDLLSGVDYVIDTLGASEFENELSVLKKGGRLLSLRTAPNKMFAQRNAFPWFKKLLFTMAGYRYDRAARKQGKEYRFIFVRADGVQLRKITEMVEKYHIVPDVDPRRFSLSQVNEALQLVAEGRLNGKVMIQM